MKTKYRNDYTPAAYLAPEIFLNFRIYSDYTEVESRVKFVKNPVGGSEGITLYHHTDMDILDYRMEGFTGESVPVPGDGNPWIWKITEPEAVWHCRCRIYPSENTALEGLYRSGGLYSTQCEAEGFRRITPFPDRPDVLSRYTVRIEAPEELCPQLLAGGNLIDHGRIDGGRHYRVYEDPFPKSSYLFAMVAGKLSMMADSFSTASGKRVALELYTEPHNIHQVDFAMDSLKRAMAWDEEVYGREYDLDTFRVVAVDDFNMGAMENKGLNIFNSSCILATPETADDHSYQFIEGVVAHEYFHNWSGNRVTCRDWFQLSLKEGFTVLRDQDFSADQNDATVQRIEDVALVKSQQFPEDSGPLCHPVRPESYIEINNFYTTTVYYKGAEIVRMLKTLLGREGYRRGCDLYFDRFDGQAVTCDDFVQSMADANGMDLSQFMLWYSQSGTPKLKVRGSFDGDSGCYTMTVTQTLEGGRLTGDEPMMMPLRLGFVSADGKSLSAKLEGEVRDEWTLVLSKGEETFVFEGFDDKPVVSLNRGFSSPVNIDFPLSEGEMLVLLAGDEDAYGRYEISRQLFDRVLERIYVGGSPEDSDNRSFWDAYGRLFSDEDLAPAIKARIMTPPSLSDLLIRWKNRDVDKIAEVLISMKRFMARKYRNEWADLYERSSVPGAYSPDAESIGLRALRAMALQIMVFDEDEKAFDLAWSLFEGADNLTDRKTALFILAQHPDYPEARRALELFRKRAGSEPLLKKAWFGLEATADRPETLERICSITQGSDYDPANPDCVRGLWRNFFRANPRQFHRKDGKGYRALADQVLVLDGVNSQSAAMVAGALSSWRDRDEERGRLMREELERIAASETLSADLYEVVTKSLAE